MLHQGLLHPVSFGRLVADHNGAVERRLPRVEKDNILLEFITSMLMTGFRL